MIDLNLQNFTPVMSKWHGVTVWDIDATIKSGQYESRPLISKNGAPICEECGIEAGIINYIEKDDKYICSRCTVERKMKAERRREKRRQARQKRKQEAQI